MAAIPPPSTAAALFLLPVIQWNDAMEQCGNDEEFLRELLVDLRTEAETQLTTIAAIILQASASSSVSSGYDNNNNAPFEQIMRSAHLLKGASANLMCEQLREASLELERTARLAHEAGGRPPYPHAVQEAIAQLQRAAQQFNVYIQSIGL
ncbi:hypothetical protein ACA910_014430 [Epithemia clementina (nom. ined.)]